MLGGTTLVHPPGLRGRAWMAEFMSTVVWQDPTFLPQAVRFKQERSEGQMTWAAHGRPLDGHLYSTKSVV